MVHAGRSAFRAIVVALALPGLGACAQMGSDWGSLFSSAPPKPPIILISDLSFAPDVAIQDGKLIASIQRDMRGQPAAAVRAEAAQRVGTVIAEEVMANLRDAGMQAARGSQGAAPPGETSIVISGLVRPARPGAGPKPKSVAFGTGRSAVVADMQVTQVSSAGRQDMLTFAAEPEPARPPPPGGPQMNPRIPGNLAPGVEADARRVANAISGRIIGFGREQGWIRPRS